MEGSNAPFITKLKFVLVLCVLFNNLSIKAQTNAAKEKLNALWRTWNDPEQKDNDRLSAISDYIWKGYIYDQPDSAIYFANLQYDFALKKGIKNHMGSALNTIGVAYRFKGNFSKSVSHHLENIKLYEETNFKKGLASSYSNIGNSYMDLGEYDLSLSYYKKSLELKYISKDSLGIAASKLNMGIVNLLKGNLKIAEELYTESLQIYELKKDKRGIANCLLNLGRVHFEHGELSKSLEYNMKSLSIREEIKDKQGSAAALLNLGLIYSTQGDKEKELELYNKALELYQIIGDQSGIAKIYTNIAITFDVTKDATKKLDYNNRSLKIHESSGDKVAIANSRVNIGNIYKNTGDLDKALEYYDESLKTFLLNDNKDKIAGTYHLIGDVYLKKRLNQKSIEFIKKSLAISNEINSDVRIRNALKALYENYLALDSLHKAKVYLTEFYKRRNLNLKNNFFTLSENEKQNYFATLESDYGLYHDFALHYQTQLDSLTDISFNIALQNKGLTLKSSTAMRQIIQNSGDTSLINQYEKWLSLKKKTANLNEANALYKELTNQTNAIEHNLLKSSILFSEFDKALNLNWHSIQNALKQKEAAIEFVHFKSEIDSSHPTLYAALIITKESKRPEMIRLCSEKELNEILGVFQGNNLNFVNSIYGTKNKAEKALYEKIWQPLEELLKDIKVVYYSPSGLLHKVSIAALSKNNNVYLCDAYQLNQQSSTGKLAITSHVQYDKKDAYLVLGGVQYNTTTTQKEVWTYLPGTLNETDNIHSFLQKKKHAVNFLSASDANESNFKTYAGKANVLHLSTHGYFFPDPDQVKESISKETKEIKTSINFRGNKVDTVKISGTLYANWSFILNKNPLMRSGLVLAGANDVWQRNAFDQGEDGVLTAQEVSNLDLHQSKLVVLSACETGLGDIKGSEGVFGLQRAFKIAGAKYLIMSLWQVPDKETAEFMKLFYKNLVKTKDIPKAFQMTQKLMRKKYDPYYWAAFVLIN